MWDVNFGMEILLIIHRRRTSARMRNKVVESWDIHLQDGSRKLKWWRVSKSHRAVHPRYLAGSEILSFTLILAWSLNATKNKVHIKVCDHWNYVEFADTHCENWLHGKVQFTGDTFVLELLILPNRIKTWDTLNER